MKTLERIKFILSLTLIGFAIIGWINLYTGYLGPRDFKISESYDVWQHTYAYGELREFRSNRSPRDPRGTPTGAGTSTSNAPIFLGLCALAGAYLLAHVRQENKSDL